MNRSVKPVMLQNEGMCMPMASTHSEASQKSETMENICQRYVAVPVFVLDTQTCYLEQMKSFRPETHDWKMVFNTVQFGLLNNKPKFTENLQPE